MTPSSNFLSRLKHGITSYASNLAAFSPNARLYLINAVIVGAALGVFRLLFNFYVLSLNYDETLIGNLTTATSLTALIAALPLGYMADIIGRKRSLVAGGSAVVVAILVMVAFPLAWVFVAMNVLIGLGQSLSGVTMGPFLMENSGSKERVYLFSFSSGLATASAFIGNWVGGRMPSWLGAAQHVSSTSTSCLRRIPAGDRPLRCPGVDPPLENAHASDECPPAFGICPHRLLPLRTGAGG